MKHTYSPIMESLTIEGVATCDSGALMLRLYDGKGEDRKFLGVETTYIMGGIFKTILFPLDRPKSPNVTYSIKKSGF